MRPRLYTPLRRSAQPGVRPVLSLHQQLSQDCPTLLLHACTFLRPSSDTTWAAVVWVHVLCMRGWPICLSSLACPCGPAHLGTGSGWVVLKCLLFLMSWAILVVNALPEGPEGWDVNKVDTQNVPQVDS